MFPGHPGIPSLRSRFERQHEPYHAPEYGLPLYYSYDTDIDWTIKLVHQGNEIEKGSITTPLPSVAIAEMHHITEKNAPCYLSQTQVDMSIERVDGTLNHRYDVSSYVLLTKLSEYDDIRAVTLKVIIPDDIKLKKSKEETDMSYTTYVNTTRDKVQQTEQEKVDRIRVSAGCAKDVLDLQHLESLGIGTVIEEHGTVYLEITPPE